jgi:peroxiredoxin (alkyl hydroperoxide reductase subunit C)
MSNRLRIVGGAVLLASWMLGCPFGQQPKQKRQAAAQPAAAAQPVPAAATAPPVAAPVAAPGQIFAVPVTEMPKTECPADDGYGRIPLIGERAPSFTAKTTQGPITFPDDYAGKWVILFSHPADFTPVCTTEFMTFASMADEFRTLNTELVGLSIDSTFSHIAWLRTILEKIEWNGLKGIEVKFPVIEDLTMHVAKLYGMLQPGASDTQAVRAVFIIDPQGIVKALFYYPLSNGRNMDEIKRLLIALQRSAAHGIATPANWRPGEDVIIPPPGSCGSAAERVQGAGADYRCLDWFLCLKGDPGDAPPPAPSADAAAPAPPAAPPAPATPPAP